MKKDSAKKLFDPKARIKIRPADTKKSDARPSGQFKTTPGTDNGLGATIK